MSVRIVIEQDVMVPMRDGVRLAFEPYRNRLQMDTTPSSGWPSSRGIPEGSESLRNVIHMPPHALRRRCSTPTLGGAFSYLTGADLHERFAYSGAARELGFDLRLTRVLSTDTVGRSGLAPQRRA